MNLKSKKTALQSLLAASAVVALCTLSAWAGGGVGDFAANGDSVGTLPSTAGTNNAASPGPGSQDAGHGIAHNGASIYITLPQQSLNQAVESATGTGFVVLVPQSRGLVRAEFHGDVTLVLNESVLRATHAAVGLVTDSAAPVLIGMRLDEIPTRPIVVAGGIATEVPVLSLMSDHGFGVQELVLESFQSPFLPSEVHITRGAGILVLTQGSF